MRNRSTRATAVAARRTEEIARLRFWGGVTVFIAGAAIALTTLVARFVAG